MDGGIMDPFQPDMRTKTLNPGERSTGLRHPEAPAEGRKPPDPHHRRSTYALTRGAEPKD